MNELLESNRSREKEKEYIKEGIGELVKYIDRAQTRAGGLSIAYRELGDHENETKLKITADILKELSKTTTKTANEVLILGSLDAAKVDSK